MLKKLFVFSAFFVTSAVALATDKEPLDLKKLFKDNSKVEGALISVYGPNNVLLKNMGWEIGKLKATVLLNRIERLTELEEEDFPKSLETPPHKEYDHIKIELLNVDRKVYAPIYVVKNYTYPEDKSLYFRDENRTFEFWLMSTSQTVEQLANANKLLRVNSYKDCVRVGNNFDETNPEKCYMPDGSVFYNTGEAFEDKDYSILNYEDCIDAGYETTEKFPRRCVSKGRVFLAPFELR